MKGLRILGLIGCLVLAACGRPTPAEQQTITFSILSAESEQSLGPLWQPLIDDLSKAIGRPVKPFFATNYTALVEAMRFNQVQVGWFSAYPALEATRRSNAEVIGRIVDANGSDSYQSVLIVKKGSGLTLDKVLACGKRLDLGMGDARSTTGALAPMTYLFHPRGVDPYACFKGVRSASHEANIAAVAEGLVDVATNNTVGLLYAARKRPRYRQAVEVIWRSPPIPESAILVRKDLDADVRDRIKQFFLGYGRGDGAEAERQRQVLQSLTYGGFRPVDASYLDPVREMEATEALQTARAGGDPARIEAAEKALEAVTAKIAADQVRPAS